MLKHQEKSAKPSNADYPVDPVERINPEARLKKAAAAGASASKSPISALMLQRPSLKEPREAQGSLSKPAGSRDTVPESSEGRSEPVITNDQVLAELRKMSVAADLQHKLTKWSVIFLAGLIPVVIGIFLLLDRHLKTKVESSLSSHQSDWSDVDRDLERGEFEKAIAIGEEIVLKTPQFPEAHERLARAYLAAGNLEKAREHYAEAFRLFPSEENEKLLSTVEKRLKEDKP